MCVACRSFLLPLGEKTKCCSAQAVAIAGVPHRPEVPLGGSALLGRLHRDKASGVAVQVCGVQVV